MVAPADALVAIPDELGAVDAAPLLCAGVTTFNALRHSGAMPGDVVAIFGIGGLGHLGVQFANKLGFRTVAIARGADKEALSRKLGADEFIDSATEDVADALVALATPQTHWMTGNIIGVDGGEVMGSREGEA